jgi:hypothetical protein
MRITEKVKNTFLRPHFIAPGNWDKDMRLFSDHGLYKRMKIPYNNGAKYDRNTLYAYFINQNEKGHRIVLNGLSMDTESNISKYIDHYVAIFESMKVEGFNFRKGTGSIGVAITRDMEMVKSFDGRHRLTVAKLLGLSKIRIRVTNVHKDLIPSKKVRFSDIAALLKELKTFSII